jgi:hypothetical protein
MSPATPTARSAAERPATPCCAVPRCDHPSPNGLVCASCVANLRADLRELIGTRTPPATWLATAEQQAEASRGRGLLEELQLTLTRQDVSGGEHVPEPPEEARTGDGPPAAVTALLFRPMASDVGRYMHEVLENWTRHLLDALHIHDVDAFGRPAPIASSGPSAWTVEYAAWLERHPDGIASNPEAGALVENIRFAVEDVRRVVFPRQLRYCGPCECDEQLYAPVGKTTVRCRSCRRRWVIADRMAALREQAKGLFLTAEDMSRALPRVASDIAIRPLTASQIRGFAHRGRLTQYPAAERGGDPRYKVGEVIALMEHLALEEQARQARRARATSTTTRDRVLAAHQRFREALQAQA